MLNKLSLCTEILNEFKAIDEEVNSEVDFTATDALQSK